MSPLAARSTGPFKFLDYFGTADESCFDGRDDAIQAVASGVLRNRTFVLYGRSGCGKTSLILAGLFPELKRRGHGATYVRTLSDPLADLHRALASHDDSTGNIPSTTADTASTSIGVDLTRTMERRLDDLLALAVASKPSVIVFDQFEEFFVRFRKDPARRSAFIRAIGTLLMDPSLDLHVLFSLRQEYVAELDDLRDFLPSIHANEYRLRSLTAFGARQSIARQLAAADVAYEPRFLTGVVDLLEGVRFDPTILQIVCTEAYRCAVERDPDAVRLTNPDLAALGGLEDLFRKFLSNLTEKLTNQLAFPCRVVLKALTTEEGTKRACRADDLMDCGFVTSREEIATVLEKLVTARLVRRDPRPDAVWYELIHERLVSIVLDWLAVDDQFTDFDRTRTLIRDMERSGIWRRVSDALLTPGQIVDIVGPHRARLQLEPAQLEYVFRSAICRCTDNPRTHDDVRYWAGRMGSEPRLAVLDELIESDDAVLRAGAAEAVGILEEHALVDRCVDLALHDDATSVRKAAARTLATTGTTSQLDEIAQAVRYRKDRDAAHAVLIERRRTGHAMPRLPLWRRWIMERRAMRDARTQRAHEIHAAGRIGAARGARAGPAWGLTAGLTTLLVISWLNGTRITDIEISQLGGLGLLLPVLALAGLVLGRSLARSAARRSFLTPDPDWHGVVIRNWLTSGTFCLIIFSYLVAIVEIVDVVDSSRIGLVIAFIVTAAAVSLLAGLVRIHQHLIGHGVIEREGWIWGFLLVAGPVATLVWLTEYAIAATERSTRVLDGLQVAAVSHSGLGMAAILFTSAIAFIASMALANPDGTRGSAATDRAPVPVASRALWRTALRMTPARATVLAWSIMNVVAYLVYYGPDTLPFRIVIPATDAASSASLTGNLVDLTIDADFHRLNVGSHSSPAVYTVQRSTNSDYGTVLDIEGTRTSYFGTLAVTLPAGKSKVWTSVSGAGGPYRMDFLRRPLHASSDTVALAPGRWTFFMVELVAEKAGSAAIGGIMGHLPPGTWEEGDEVVLTFVDDVLDPPPAGFKESGTLVAGSGFGGDTGPAYPTTWVIGFNRPVGVSTLPGMRDDPYLDVVRRLPVDPATGVWGTRLTLRSGYAFGDPASAPEAATQRVTRDTLPEHRVHLIAAVTITPGNAVAVAPNIDPSLGAIEALERAESASDPQSARRALEDAVRLSMTSMDAEAASSVCWRGMLEREAATVLEACEFAVATDSTNGDFRDSRGAARAQLGDTAGAVQDFEAFIDWARGRFSEDRINQRMMWIKRLSAGENPFTDSVTLRRLGAR